MVHLMMILRTFMADLLALLQQCLAKNPHQALGRYPLAMGLGVFLLKQK
jgi:hypothetical protein